VVELRLSNTTLGAGGTIHGDLILRNTTSSTIDYWEGDWPFALLRGNTVVGGFDNTAESTAGYLRYQLRPGQEKQYPRDIDFAGWEGTIDTLQCHSSPYARRAPLPPDQYTAMVSFPVGDRFEQPAWQEGAQGRAQVRITP
jgi:hypothetical protein